MEAVPGGGGEERASEGSAGMMSAVMLVRTTRRRHRRFRRMLDGNGVVYLVVRMRHRWRPLFSYYFPDGEKHAPFIQAWLEKDGMRERKFSDRP